MSCRFRGLWQHLIMFSDGHTHTPHSVGLLWTSNRRVTLYLTTHNTHKIQPWPRRDSNPQSQQANGPGPRLSGTRIVWLDYLGLGSADFGVSVRSGHLILNTCTRIIGPTPSVTKAVRREMVGRYRNWKGFRGRIM